MDLMEKYLVRGRRTASRIWGGTAVVLMPIIGSKGPDRGRGLNEEVFELSPSGTFLWKILEKKPKVKEAVKRFMRKYKIAREPAKQILIEFIKDLSKKGLIEIANDIQ